MIQNMTRGFDYTRCETAECDTNKTNDETLNISLESGGRHKRFQWWGIALYETHKGGVQLPKSEKSRCGRKTCHWAPRQKIVEIMGMQKQRYVFPRTERASPTLPLESLMINVHQESMLCFIESAPFIAANFPHEIFFPNAFQKADLRLCVF